MTTLHIGLHDGFAGDSVAIRLDGRQVYRKDGVRTDLRISRADEVDVDAAAQRTEVEVRARGRSATTVVEPATTPYLSVDLDPDGRPSIRASTEPFAYL